MKMNNLKFNLTLLILFISYTFIVSLIPFKTFTFYISYLFTVIAFVLQFGLIHYLDNSLTIFNSLPLWTVSSIYLVLQIVLSIIMISLNVFVIFAIIIQVILLSIILILEISLSQSKEYIENIEEKDKNRLKFFIFAKKEIQLLITLTNNDLKEDMENLYEFIQYLNPTSNSETYSLEKNIINELRELRNALNSNNNEKALFLIDSIKREFEEREIILRK